MTLFLQRCDALHLIVDPISGIRSSVLEIETVQGAKHCVKIQSFKRLMPGRGSNPMKVRAAINYFGGLPAIAKRLKGYRHRSAPYQWDVDGLVPLQSALLLEKLERGKRRNGITLEVNLNEYERHKDRRDEARSASQEDPRRRRL